MPPFKTPSKARWCGCGVQSQTSSSPRTKLRILSPFSLAGPQPKHRLAGAKRSWRLNSSGGTGRLCHQQTRGCQIAQRVGNRLGGEGTKRLRISERRALTDGDRVVSGGERLDQDPLEIGLVARPVELPEEEAIERSGANGLMREARDRLVVGGLQPCERARARPLRDVDGEERGRLRESQESGSANREQEPRQVALGLIRGVGHASGEDAIPELAEPEEARCESRELDERRLDERSIGREPRAGLDLENLRRRGQNVRLGI